MSEQVYVVSMEVNMSSSDPWEILGVARTIDVAQAIALEFFDDEEARVDSGDPMHIFGGWVDAYIEVYDLVG